MQGPFSHLKGSNKIIHLFKLVFYPMQRLSRIGPALAVDGDKQQITKIIISCLYFGLIPFREERKSQSPPPPH